MDMFVCNILWWDEQYDLMIYLRTLGMNRFFEKEKDFSFAYSGSEKKKDLCSNMQTLKVQQQLQPQPQPH